MPARLGGKEEEEEEEEEVASNPISRNNEKKLREGGDKGGLAAVPKEREVEGKARQGTDSHFPILAATVELRYVAKSVGSNQKHRVFFSTIADVRLIRKDTVDNYFYCYNGA